MRLIKFFSAFFNTRCVYIVLFVSFNLSSFSRNSIYSVHYTYYSLAISSILSTFFIITFLFLCECFLFFSPFNSRYNLVLLILLCFTLRLDFILLLVLTVLFILFSTLYLEHPLNLALNPYLMNPFIFRLCFICLLMFLSLRLCLIVSFSFLITFYLFLWINDYITECVFCFSRTECFSLVFSIKLFILSEFMLFFCVFWTQLNFRFILNVFSCFYSLPLLSSFCFAIPYSNVLILLFSSLPVQACLIFYKFGLFFCCIEQLGQTVSCGMVFLVLQLKEFFYSFHSISDCMIGCIFYFTTSLHGLHVFLGLCYFASLLFIYFSFVMFYFSSFFCINFSCFVDLLFIRSTSISVVLFFCVLRFVNSVLIYFNALCFVLIAFYFCSLFSLSVPYYLVLFILVLFYCLLNYVLLLYCALRYVLIAFCFCALFKLTVPLYLVYYYIFTSSFVNLPCLDAPFSYAIFGFIILFTSSVVISLCYALRLIELYEPLAMLRAALYCRVVLRWAFWSFCLCLFVPLRLAFDSAVLICLDNYAILWRYSSFVDPCIEPVPLLINYSVLLCSPLYSFWLVCWYYIFSYRLNAIYSKLCNSICVICALFGIIFDCYICWSPLIVYWTSLYWPPFCYVYSSAHYLKKTIFYFVHYKSLCCLVVYYYYLVRLIRVFLFYYYISWLNLVHNNCFCLIHYLVSFVDLFVLSALFSFYLFTSSYIVFVFPFLNALIYFVNVFGKLCRSICSICALDEDLFTAPFTIDALLIVYFALVEFSDSLMISSLYWHFVDIIWIIVFYLYFY